MTDPQMTTLELSNEMSKFIQDSIREYTANMDQYGIQALDEPSYQDSPALVRASSMSTDKCPKRVAAEKWGVVPVPQSDLDMYKFGLAKFAAMMAKVAISNAVGIMGSDPDQRAAGIEWAAHPEWSAKSLDGDLSGTIDLLIIMDEPDHRTMMPVEIKRTDKNYGFGGLAAYAVWQTITYLKLLQEKFGFVVTLFDGKKDDFKVWTVLEVPGGWRVLDGIYPVQPAAKSDLPVDADGFVFFGREAYDGMLVEFKAWSKRYKALLYSEDTFIATLYGSDQAEAVHSIPVDGMSPLSYPCADYTPEKRYSLKGRGGKGGGPGDVVPGTGSAEVLCPLYGHCYKRRLVAKNIPLHPVPRILEAEEIDGIADLKEYVPPLTVSEWSSDAD